jgi:TPR repeat protein
MIPRVVPALLLGTLLALAAEAATPSSDLVRQAGALMADGKLQEAESLLRRDAAPGDFDAAAALGALLIVEGRLPDAIVVLRPAAEAGKPDAQWRLSEALARSTPPDAEGADRWLRRAADGGSSKAKLMLQTRAQTPLSTDAQGRVATADLKRMLRGVIVAKVADSSAQVLACYGASRETLIGYYDAALTRCFAELPMADQVRVTPSEALSRQLGKCSTLDVIHRAGTTPPKLIACLPTK